MNFICADIWNIFFFYFHFGILYNFFFLFSFCQKIFDFSPLNFFFFTWNSKIWFFEKQSCIDLCLHWILQVIKPTISQRFVESNFQKISLKKTGSIPSTIHFDWRTKTLFRICNGTDGLYFWFNQELPSVKKKKFFLSFYSPSL